MIRYGSVCSGIEAATAAWHPLGWQPAFFSEIEPFPRAVLAHHYPGVPLHGDFTTIGADEYGPIDLLVGGTPCQSFSIAGLRGGLADDRGNLALEFLRLADRTRPRWVVWENVPGVLSSNGGRDFGAILGGLVELGYGFAYRVLDAQHFGVPQRRRRVFVVGYSGDWRRAAAVLFERHSLSGHPAPRRETGEGASYGFADRTVGGIAKPLGAHSLSKGRGTDLDNTTYIAFDTTQITSAANYSSPKPGDPCHPLAAGAHAPAVAFDLRGREDGSQFEGPHDTANIRAASGGSSRSYVAASAVRRLTPRECERLQGFPDDYTLIPYRNKPASECPDGPRYKALGNSMAVPCMAWIGQRIAAVEALSAMQEAA
jgi:DNA (cytosine-5)-methyltransferase 1